MEVTPINTVAELARGPYGRCFRAIDKTDGRQLLVVKTEIVDRTEGAAPNPMTRLIEETHRLTKAHSGGLVQVRSLRREGRSVDVVFESPSGTRLDELLAQQSLQRDTAIRIARSLLAAVAEAHALDVPHRSLSARDVFVAEDHRVTVTGFGLTRTSDSPAQASAPEIAGGEPATEATDQFNLGHILALISAATEPRLLLEDVIATACSQSPDGRFSDLFDMAAAFEEAVQGFRKRETEATSEHAAPHSESGRSRRIFPLATAAGLVLVLTSVTAAVSWRSEHKVATQNATTQVLPAADVAEKTNTSEMIQRAEDLIQTGHFAEARPLLELALASDSLDNPAPILATLGTIRLKLGDVDRAIHDLRRAAELDPQADVFYRLSLALASAGRAPEARSAVAVGLNLDPDHIQLTQAKNHLGG